MTTNTATILQSLGLSQKDARTPDKEGPGQKSMPGGESPFSELMAGLSGKTGGETGTKSAVPGNAATAAEASSPALAATSGESTPPVSIPSAMAKTGPSIEVAATAPSATTGDALEETAVVHTQTGQGAWATTPETGPQIVKGLLDTVSTQNHAPQLTAGKNAAGRFGGSPSQGPAAGQKQSVTTGTADLFSEFAVNGGRVSDKGLQSTGTPLPKVTAASVKILRQETHFAPTLRLSPVQQIGAEITSALKAEAIPSGRDQASLTIKPEGQAVKALEIQLRPAELGTVKVTLKIVGDTVEVALRTSNPETAELLKQDRQMLDQMLRATGYKADSITILAGDERPQMTTAQSQTASGSSAGQDHTQGNPAFGQTSRDGAAEKGDPENSRSANEELSPTEDDARNGTDEDHQPDTRSNGVYL